MYTRALRCSKRALTLPPKKQNQKPYTQPTSFLSGKRALNFVNILPVNYGGEKKKTWGKREKGGQRRILLQFALSTKGEEKSETKKTRDNKKID